MKIYKFEVEFSIGESNPAHCAYKTGIAFVEDGEDVGQKIIKAVAPAKVVNLHTERIDGVFYTQDGMMFPIN